MPLQIKLEADEFWPSLESDIRGAKEYAYAQVLSFEGDVAGQRVADAFKQSSAPDRRVIADEFYTIKRINDKFLPLPTNWFNREIRRERDKTLAMFEDLKANGIDYLLTNPTGLINEYWLHRNHKKIIAIDDRVAYLGGFNFTDHNFEWHDMMVRIDDPEVVRFLKDDVQHTWRGINKNKSRKFDGMEIFRFDGRTNRKTFQPIMDLMSNARESIYIISPYITYPFWDLLRKARANGARTVLIAPEVNNWKFLSEYSEWESIRSGVEVRLYPGRMVHLKAMLIDDTHLVVGSSNFDFLSCRLMQEIVAVITDRDTIEDFKKRVLEKDMQISVPSTRRVSNFRGHYVTWSFKFIEAVFSGI